MPIVAEIKLPELIADIAIATGHSQSIVRSIINNFLLQIEGSRFRPDAPAIRIHGFGRFWLSKIEARETRNPRTGELMAIPATRRLRFTPSKALLARIQGEQSQMAQVVVLKKRRLAKS